MSGSVGDNTARASGVIASAGGGTILSVKSMKYTDTISNSGTAPTQISAFDMSFAATESDSKLLFQAYMTLGNSSDLNSAGYFYDVTNGAKIGAVGDSSGSRQQLSWGGQGQTTTHGFIAITWGIWHEPGTTSSIDYTVYGNGQSTQTMYINRSQQDANNTYMYSARLASTFMITEYAADTVTLT